MAVARAIRKTIKAELAAGLVNLRGPDVEQHGLLVALSNPASVQTALKTLHLSVHSQFDEDGILLALFGAIGLTNRYCIELCAGDAIESNSANLIINHGWTGLLCDGDNDNVRCARRFFRRCRATRIWPPKVVQHWLTVENVEEFLAAHDVPAEPDLLSIDVDGNDYWIWRAIESVMPRVVVIEINHLWGAERSVTIPYAKDFKAVFSDHGTDYAGASLPAMSKLAAAKGYRLVAVNSVATNAFFVRNGSGDNVLPPIDPADCFDHPRAQYGRRIRLPKVRDREWVDV